MARKAFAIFLMAFFFAAGPAFAAERTPASFLHSIYDRYAGHDSNKSTGLYGGKHYRARNYFVPDLVALMNRDAAIAKKNGEVPLLDGDPFIDAQEWKIGAIDITVESATSDTAVGIVRFKNDDKPVRLTVDLAKSQGKWRIGDIDDGSGETLRGIFKDLPK